jgi:hypothetical protein
VSLWKRTKTKTHTVFLLAKLTPLNIDIGSDRFAMFNKERDIFWVTYASFLLLD